MRKVLVLAAMWAALPSAGLAATWELTIKNGFVETLNGLSISDAEVEGFRPIAAGGSRVVEVTLPDHECVAHVTVTFADTQSMTVGAVDFCESNLLEIGF